MKSSKAIVTILVISILLFLAGQVAYSYFFHLVEPTIDGISLEVTNGDGSLKTSLLFSGALLLIPILSYMLWRLAPINSLQRRIASLLIILLFISIAIFIRHQEVKTYFIRVVRPALLTNGKTRIDYPIDPINFVYYILGGLFLGLIISWPLLKQRNK